MHKIRIRLTYKNNLTSVIKEIESSLIYAEIFFFQS